MVEKWDQCCPSAPLSNVLWILFGYILLCPPPLLLVFLGVWLHLPLFSCSAFLSLHLILSLSFFYLLSELLQSLRRTQLHHNCTTHELTKASLLKSEETIWKTFSYIISDYFYIHAFFLQFFKNLPKTDICWKRSICSCLVSASKSVQKTAAEISKSDSQSQPRSSRKKLEKRLWRTRNWRKWFDWFNFFSWCDLFFCDISTKSSCCSCLHYRFWTHCTVAKLRPHVFIPPHDITLWVWSFHLLIDPYLTQGPPPVS